MLLIDSEYQIIIGLSYFLCQKFRNFADVMAKFDLSGLGVALCTPFTADCNIDFDSLGRLIDSLISGGADYLVALGTTAETPTLTARERVLVKDFVRDTVAGRVPLVLGHGGNNTAALARELAEEDTTGYSAILSVVPFYNKPSQEGIFRHYSELAKVSPLPLVLYNVPGRTGVNMQAETVLRLAAEHNNIIGVKEASGNVEQAKAIMAGAPEGFQLVSGDDGMTLELIKAGACGVISVVGNAFPREFGRMVRLAMQGDYERAELIHNQFAELYDLLFVDGNPAGIKCMLHMMERMENVLRLPLVPTRPVTDEKMHRVLDRLRHHAK